MDRPIHHPHSTEMSAEQYVIRTLAVALKRVQRECALGDITQAIVGRALALALAIDIPTPLTRCVTIDESWTRDD